MSKQSQGRLTGISNASLTKRRDKDNNSKNSVWDVSYEFSFEHMAMDGNGETVLRTSYDGKTETFSTPLEALNRLTDVLCVYQHGDMARVSMADLAEKDWNGHEILLCKHYGFWDESTQDQPDACFRCNEISIVWDFLRRVWWCTLGFVSEDHRHYRISRIPFGKWKDFAEFLAEIPGTDGFVECRELERWDALECGKRKSEFDLILGYAEPDYLHMLHPETFAPMHPDQLELTSTDSFPRQVRHREDKLVLMSMEIVETGATWKGCAEYHLIEANVLASSSKSYGKDKGDDNLPWETAAADMDEITSTDFKDLAKKVDELDINRLCSDS